MKDASSSSAARYQRAVDIIAQHPTWCYRRFVSAYPDVFNMDPGCEGADALEAARPACGYDCDDRCPVSGAAER